jgi:hypothetical protein
MSTIEIKEHLHEYIDQADERMLKLLYALAQADFEEREYQLSDKFATSQDPQTWK